MSSRIGSLANIEIEKAMLGSLINGGRSLIDELCIAAIDANLFYYSQSREILGAIAKLYDEGAPIDSRIVTERLRQQGNLDAVGGVAEITMLGADGNPAVDIARFNLAELWALYAKRQAARIADRMKSGDIDVADAKAMLDEIIESTHTQKKAGTTR